MPNKYLITTAIDYVNDVIHIGHAYQKILADALARYYRGVGEEVFFLTGTDEHGTKTEETARERGIEPKNVADEISAQDQAQLDALNISYDRFIRTTDADHYQVVKEFYERVYNNGRGDIYLGEYTGLYCVGCETFLKEKDLVDGKCPLHPTKEPIMLTEKNYFFAWSKYADFLRDYINNHPDFVQHEARKNEMLAFIEQGLEDIPISRPNVKFGIPVPNDPEHVLYVWFDALINYVTGQPSAWADNNSRIIHLLGKDNVRWHALLWPAMLQAAGYRLPTTVYGHDFFTINGQRISKSVGNVIRPTDLVAQFGVDAVRYYFLRYGPIRDDVDVSLDGIKEVYNGDLANGLGNLVARVAKVAEKSGLSFPNNTADDPTILEKIAPEVLAFRVDLALGKIWEKIHELDRYVDHHRIWELKGEEQKEKLEHLIAQIRELAVIISPFLPNTAKKIQLQFQLETIRSTTGLFLRLN
jgi:methionyl-tRNA synthetase